MLRRTVGVTTGQPSARPLPHASAHVPARPSLSPARRLYAFTDAGGKTKPGMVAVQDGSGAAVHLEVWEMPIENFGRFMLQVTGGGARGTLRQHAWAAAGCLRVERQPCPAGRQPWRTQLRADPTHSHVRLC